MDRDRLVSLIAQSPFFANAAPERLAALAEAGRARAFAKGETVCATGDAPDGLYVVLSGRVLVSSFTAAGKEIVLDSLTEGAMLGEMAVLDGEPRSADVVCAQASELFFISKADVVRALREDPDFALSVLAALSRRLRAANALIESVSFHDIEGRLARLVLSLAGVDADDPPEGPVAIDRPYAQGELARRIAASREKVNQQLRRWAGAGLVETTREGLRLLDVDALVELSLGDEDL